MTIKPDLARAILLMGPALGVFLVSAWRRPSRHMFAGGLLSFLWLLVFLPPLNYLAVYFDWWRFDTSGDIFLGIPFDILLGWAFAWGPFALFLLPRLNIWILTALAISLDILAMPNFGPLIVLGDNWLIGEVVVILLAFLPAQTLARLTLQRRYLAIRSTLQAVGFGTLVGFFGPAVLFTSSGQGAPVFSEISFLGLGFAGLIGAGLVMLGWTASQEFTVRGMGTPIPFDPPQKLVTTGPYSYLANPMQLCTLSMTAVLGVLFWQPLLFFTAFYGWLFCVSVVPWHNKHHISKTFPEGWPEYRAQVHNWFPHWRPVIFEQGMLEVNPKTQTAKFFMKLDVKGLKFKPNQKFKGAKYSSGNFECTGLEAFSRALDHTNLGLAFFGWVIRFPLFFMPSNLFSK